MKTVIASAVAALMMAGVAVPASAQGLEQLAASAGISRTAAAGMSLDQIAAAKFNRGVSRADQQTVPGSTIATPSRAAGAQLARHNGVGGYEAPSLSEIAAHHFNRGVSVHDRQTVAAPTPGAANDHAQLAAAAGLSVEEAASMSLGEISATFFNRRQSQHDWQTVGAR